MSMNFPNLLNILKPKVKEKTIYPDFPRRLLSTLIDITIFYLITSPIGYILSLVIFAGPSPSTQLQQIIKNSYNPENTQIFNTITSSPEYLNFMVKYGYGSIIFEQLFQLSLFAIAMLICLRKYHSTPGKMIMAIKLVKYDDHTTPSMSQHILRGIAALFSILPLGVGYLTVLGSKENRALHDIISNTVIINAEAAKTNAQ